MTLRCWWGHHRPLKWQYTLMRHELECETCVEYEQLQSKLGMQHNISISIASTKLVVTIPNSMNKKTYWTQSIEPEVANMEDLGSFAEVELCAWCYSCCNTGLGAIVQQHVLNFKAIIRTRLACAIWLPPWSVGAGVTLIRPTRLK
jgi:hypothetical protein